MSIFGLKIGDSPVHKELQDQRDKILRAIGKIPSDIYKKSPNLQEVVKSIANDQYFEEHDLQSIASELFRAKMFVWSKSIETTEYLVYNLHQDAYTSEQRNMLAALTELPKKNEKDFGKLLTRYLPFEVKTKVVGAIRTLNEQRITNALSGIQNRGHENLKLRILRTLPKEKRDKIAEAIQKLKGYSLNYENTDIEDATNLLKEVADFYNLAELVEHLLKATRRYTSSSDSNYQVLFSMHSGNRATPAGMKPHYPTKRTNIPRIAKNEEDRKNLQDALAADLDVLKKKEELEQIEIFLRFTIAAQQRGIDVNQFIKTAEALGVFNVDKVVRWAANETLDTTVKTIRSNEGNWLDQLAITAAKAKSKNLEHLIEIVIKKSVDIKLIVDRKLAEKKEAYRSTHFATDMSCYGPPHSKKCTTTKVPKDPPFSLVLLWATELREKEIHSILKKMFRNAEKYWDHKRPKDLPYFSDLPQRYSEIKTAAEWFQLSFKNEKLDSGKYTNLGTIKETLRTTWLAGTAKKEDFYKIYEFQTNLGIPLSYLISSSSPISPVTIPYTASFLSEITAKSLQVHLAQLHALNVNSTTGYIPYFVDVVNESLPSGIGKMTPMAACTANTVFPEKYIEIPEDPEKLATFNKYHTRNLSAVFSATDYDRTLNGIGMFYIGILAAMSGIYVANTFRGGIIAWEASAGLTASKMSLAGRAGLWLLELGGESLGFNIGVTGATLYLNGFPSSLEFNKGWVTGGFIFGGLRGLNLLRIPFGFRAGAGLKLIHGEAELAMTGRGLRATQAAIGYSGSRLGLLYEASHFVATAEYLQLIDIPLSYINLVDAVPLKYRHGWLDSLTHYASLFTFIMGARSSIRFNTRPIEAAQLKFEMKEHTKYLERSFKSHFDSLNDRLKYESDINARLSEISRTHEIFARSQRETVDQLEARVLEKRIIPIINEQRHIELGINGASELINDLRSFSAKGRLELNGTLKLHRSTDPTRFAIQSMGFNLRYGKQIRLVPVGQNGNGKVGFTTVVTSPALNGTNGNGNHFKVNTVPTLARQQNTRQYKFVVTSNNPLADIYHLAFPRAKVVPAPNKDSQKLLDTGQIL